MNQLRVLALGDVDHPEMRDSYQSVSRCDWVTVANDPQATRPVELILVFQARPGSIDASVVAELHVRHPLAGFAVVLGSWCEGETRTGQPLPYCQRVFWYQFPAWWQQACSAWSEGRPTNWLQPPGGPKWLPRLERQLIAIDTPDADAAEALLLACESLGATAVWSPRWRTRPMASKPVAGIWVGGQLEEFEEPELASFRQSLPDSAPLVALLDFPRRDRARRAIELGATAVLGKPWRLDELAACLDGQPSASAT